MLLAGVAAGGLTVVGRVTSSATDVPDHAVALVLSCAASQGVFFSRGLASYRVSDSGRETGVPRDRVWPVWWCWMVGPVGVSRGS